MKNDPWFKGLLAHIVISTGASIRQQQLRDEIALKNTGTCARIIICCCLLTKWNNRVPSIVCRRHSTGAAAVELFTFLKWVCVWCVFLYSHRKFYFFLTKRRVLEVESRRIDERNFRLCTSVCVCEWWWWWWRYERKKDSREFYLSLCQLVQAFHQVKGRCDAGPQLKKPSDRIGMRSLVRRTTTKAID